MSKAVSNTEYEPLRLTELISPEVIKLPMFAGDKRGAIKELTELLIDRGQLVPELEERAIDALQETEAIRSSGWKYGLAFPNGRVVGLQTIVAAVGVSHTGIKFDCRDGLDAKIIVMILFPVACYARFSGAISELTQTFERPELREAILTAKQTISVVEAIETVEAQESA